MDGVRLGEDDLIRTYGISRRLAVRAGALLARGIELSATLLEIAGPGSAVEKLLLRPEMLTTPLDDALLRRLARETRAEADGPFALMPTERGQVLALEEERLAEKGWQQAARASEEQRLPACTGVASPARFLAPDESRRLFTPDEVARLKLEALAGRDADARVSALRKLIYAPLSDQERGGICLRALLDSAGPVRAEAIRAMEQLGFHRDTADAMQALFSGDPRAREAGLRRIGDLIGGLQPGERRIVLAVLVEALRESRPRDERDPLLRLWLNLAPTLRQETDAAPEAARVCVQHLLADPRRLGSPMRELLAALAEGTPGPVIQRLWEEIETVSDPLARPLLLGVLIESDRRPESALPLARKTVEELLREGIDEVERQKLGHNLAALGDTAAGALLERFHSAPLPEKAALVAFLDLLAMDDRLPAATRHAVARRLLDALKTADRRLRLAVLNTRCLWQAPLDAGLRRDLAAELLPMVRAHERTDVADQAAALLERLGDAAVPGLNALMRERPTLPQADLAARMLGRILARPEIGDTLRETTAAVFEFAFGRVALPSNLLGGYAEALGLLASREAVPQARAQAALDLAIERFGKVRYHGDIVAAIGALAAGPRVTPEQRVRAAELLGRILDRPGDREDVRLKETLTAKGKVYHVTGRVDFDTDTLPAAVNALAALAVSEHPSEALRAQVSALLLRVWKDVAEWKTVWGPRSSEALALALGRVGACPGTDDAARAEIIAALALAADRQSVLRALAGVFAAIGNGPRSSRAAVVAGLKVLEEWIEPQLPPEPLQWVLTAATAAVAAQPAPPRAGEARTLRKRTVDLLYDALRAGHPWCRPLLQSLADSPACSRPLRKEIAERLAQTAPLPAPRVGARPH